MPNNITINAMVLLLNAGGWALKGGYYGKSITSMSAVTRVTLENDVLRVECGDALIEKKIDRMEVDSRPREIKITSLVKIKQQRAQKYGGGQHEVEQVTVLLRFVNEEAGKRDRAARREKQEEVERQNRIKQEAERKSAKQRAEERDAAEENAKNVELTLEDGGIVKGLVKCVVLYCDHKEDFDNRKINSALRQVFDGKNCPALANVPNTGGDMNGLVIGSVAINAKQAQLAWNQYLKNRNALPED